MGADAELDFLTCDSGLRAVLGLSVMSLEEASTIQPGLLTLSCTKQMVPTRRAPDTHPCLDSSVLSHFTSPYLVSCFLDLFLFSNFLMLSPTVSTCALCYVICDKCPVETGSHPKDQKPDQTLGSPWPQIGCENPVPQFFS